MKEHHRCVLDTKKIIKWGNSAGVLLPKSVLENLNLSLGKEVRFVFEAGKIYLKNASNDLHIPDYDLEELMKEYDLQQDVIDNELSYDFQPVGREIINP